MKAILKKTSVLFATVALALSVSGCEPAWGNMGDEIGDARIVSVQLIEYDNPDGKVVVNTIFKEVDVTTPFDFVKMEILKELSEENIEAFMLDISGPDTYMDPWTHSDSPNGVGFRIIAENGDFWVMTKGTGMYDQYFGYFASDGALISHFGEPGLIEMEALAEKWFEVSIEELLS